MTVGCGAADEGPSGRRSSLRLGLVTCRQSPVGVLVHGVTSGVGGAGGGGPCPDFPPRVVKGSWGALDRPPDEDAPDATDEGSGDEPPRTTGGYHDSVAFPRVLPVLQGGPSRPTPLGVVHWSSTRGPEARVSLGVVGRVPRAEVEPSPSTRCYWSSSSWSQPV